MVCPGDFAPEEYDGGQDFCAVGLAESVRRDAPEELLTCRGGLLMGARVDRGGCVGGGGVGGGQEPGVGGREGGGRRGGGGGGGEVGGGGGGGRRKVFLGV